MCFDAIVETGDAFKEVIKALTSLLNVSRISIGSKEIYKHMRWRMLNDSNFAHLKN